MPRGEYLGASLYKGFIMDINSVGNISNVSASFSKDEKVHQQSVGTGGHIAADGIEPVVQASRDAVQALDPKAQSEQLEDAVKKINDTIRSMNRNVELNISTDEETKKRLVKVIDTSSKEVLRQYPTEEVLSIAKAIDKFQGLLVKDKA